MYARARVFDLSYRRRSPTVTTIRIGHALLNWNAAAIFEVKFPVGTNVEKKYVEIIKKEIRFNCAAFCLESEHSMLGASRVSLNFDTQTPTQPTHAHTHNITHLHKSQAHTHTQNHTHAHTNHRLTRTYNTHKHSHIRMLKNTCAASSTPGILTGFRKRASLIRACKGHVAPASDIWMQRQK